MRWFISDLHLGDHRLLKRRYSKNVDQFDNFLASRWESKVKPDDEVWVLGDVARGRDDDYVRDWFDMLPGEKHLVIGNWDEPHGYWDAFDSACHRAHILLSDDTRVTMSHYPYGHPKNPEYTNILLHGHTHSPRKVSRSAAGTLQIHVGWDAWRTLASEQRIIELINKNR